MLLVLVLVSNRDHMIIAYFFESLIDALPIQMGCDLIIKILLLEIKH